MNKKILEANSQSFTDAIVSNDLVFVDFYADWCGPCRIIAPSVDKLADEFDGKVKFVRLNIDENPETARRYGVTSIPRLIIFRNGKPFRTMIGASPIGHYRGELQKVITKIENNNREGTG